MPVTRTFEYEDHHTMLDNMSDSVASLEALASMLNTSLHSGDNLKNEAHGIYILLKQQCADLEFLRSALWNEIDSIKSSKLTIKDSETIALAVGLSKYTVNNVIHAATGIYVGPPNARSEATHAE